MYFTEDNLETTALTQNYDQHLQQNNFYTSTDTNCLPYNSNSYNYIQHQDSQLATINYNDFSKFDENFVPQIENQNPNNQLYQHQINNLDSQNMQLMNNEEWSFCCNTNNFLKESNRQGTIQYPLYNNQNHSNSIYNHRNNVGLYQNYCAPEEVSALNPWIYHSDPIYHHAPPPKKPRFTNKQIPFNESTNFNIPKKAPEIKTLTTHNLRQWCKNFTPTRNSDDEDYDEQAVADSLNKIRRKRKFFVKKWLKNLEKYDDLEVFYGVDVQFDDYVDLDDAESVKNEDEVVYTDLMKLIDEYIDSCDC